MTKRYLVINIEKESNRANSWQDIVYNVEIMGVFKTKKLAEDFVKSNDIGLAQLIFKVDPAQRRINSYEWRTL